MALSITITARKLLQRLEAASNAKLNQLGLPTLAISGTASTAQIADGAVTAVKGAYGPWFYCSDGGGANTVSLTAYSASATVLPTILSVGQVFRFRVNTTNTGAVTVAVSGIAGTLALEKGAALALQAGDLRAGQEVEIVFTGFEFRLLAPLGQPDWPWFVETAGADGLAYTATFAPTVTALKTGSAVTVKWNITNTGAVTLAANGLTAKAVRKANDAALAAGDILDNQISTLVYDSTANAAAGAWLLTGPTAQSSARVPVAVRQTVLGGSVGSTGVPNFLTFSGQLVSFQNTSASLPVVLAFAQGFDSSGSVDYAGVISTNVASAWTVSTTNGTYYLYIERNSGTGALTYGVSGAGLRPTYIGTGVASTTSGQHTFLRNNMTMYVGDGVTATAVQRVFVAEAVVSGGALASVTAYRLQGKFQSPADQTVAANNADATFAETHALGAAPQAARWVYVCQSADLNYVAGDEVPAVNLYDVGGSYATPAPQWVNATSMALVVPATLYVMGFVNRTSYDATVAIDATKWKVRAYAERGW